MENKTTVQPYNLAMRFGLYYSLSAIAIDLIFFVFNISYTGYVNGILKTILAVIVLYFAMKFRRQEMPGNYLTYSQGLGIGTWTVLFGSLVISVYSLIYTQYIDPDGIERTMREVKQQMIAKDNSEEEIEAALGMMRKMKSPAFSVPLIFIGSFINGFVLSLIVAIFTRKKDPQADYTNLDV